MAIDDVPGFLAQVEAALTGLDRSDLLGRLRPGRSAAEVQGFLGSVGLPSNAELEALYGWRDGTSADGAVLDDLHMFPGFYLLSIEDAVADYRAFAGDQRWSVGWLPLFANGGGDFYVVDLARRDECAVRHFRIEESEHPIEFSSIGDMLRTLAEAFQRGTFFVDVDGYLEMDDGAFAELAGELNPQIGWWTEEGLA